MNNITDYCAKCGKKLTEIVETELIFTYHCDYCGCYAEQHYKVEYDRTDIIEN